MVATTPADLTVTAEDIAEVLPLTQGEGSLYRKDEETGKVNHTKVSTGAETARTSFKMSMPKLSSPDFKSFIAAAKSVAEAGSIAFVKTYSDDAIDRVKTGGITGAIANKLIKNKYGEK
ncbi:MAG: hypothetical protein NC200_05945 [Candidatus Gastranaerophilales bacterium]|nr:hypothetical protein [Candidatus Gastranaerophilales bacterium]